jgi:hypothetical protein
MTSALAIETGEMPHRTPEARHKLAQPARAVNQGPEAGRFPTCPEISGEESAEFSPSFTLVSWLANGQPYRAAPAFTFSTI